MSHIKKRIEENFQSIKESLSSSDKDQQLKLPRIQKEWYVSLTLFLSKHSGFVAILIGIVV